MRVLITGAAGFIGSHLAERLLADGHRVWGIDNLLTGRNDNVPEDVALFRGDICDRRLFYMAANTAEPDLIVHCAASYSDPQLWHRDVETNVAGTVNVINAASYHNAKLVYFQTALPPVSSYAISKIAAEQYINLSKIPALTFRLANIYGPRNVSGPVPTFYKRLTQRLPCTIVDTGRDVVYIDDLIHAVMLAVDGDMTGRFDIRSGKQTSILAQYKAVLAHLAGFPNVEASFSSAPLVQPGADDVQTILDGVCVPGWEPTWGLFDGVGRAVDWYRHNGVEETFTHLKLGATRG